MELGQMVAYGVVREKEVLERFRKEERERADRSLLEYLRKAAEKDLEALRLLVSFRVAMAEERKAVAAERQATALERMVGVQERKEDREDDMRRKKEKPDFGPGVITGSLRDLANLAGRP